MRERLAAAGALVLLLAAGGAGLRGVFRAAGAARWDARPRLARPPAMPATPADAEPPAAASAFDSADSVPSGLEPAWPARLPEAAPEPGTAAPAAASAKAAAKARPAARPARRSRFKVLQRLAGSEAEAGDSFDQGAPAPNASAAQAEEAAPRPSARGGQAPAAAPAAAPAPRERPMRAVTTQSGNTAPLPPGASQDPPSPDEE